MVDRFRKEISLVKIKTFRSIILREVFIFLQENVDSGSMAMTSCCRFRSLFQRPIERIDLQGSDPPKQKCGEDHGHYFRKRDGPPHHGQPGYHGKEICRREYDQKLARGGYDQAVYPVAKSLKNGAYDDTVSRENKAQADDTQRRDPDFQHMLGGIEKPQELCRENLEYGQSHQHDADSHPDTQLHSGYDSFFISGAVIVGDDRDHAIIEPEHRHKNKALQFKIDTEDSRRGGREHKQDLVHPKYHHGTDGLHDDRGNADLIDRGDDLPVRPESLHVQVQLLVFGAVKIKGKYYGHDLSGHRSDGCPGHLQARKTEQAEDQDGIHDDVDDGSDSLRDHGVNGLSGGLQKPFQGHLHEYSDGEDGYDRQVLCTVSDDLFILRLEPEKCVRNSQPEHSHEPKADEGKKDSVPGGAIGLIELLFAQIPGEQSVDPHACPGGNGDHQALYGKG